MHLLTYILDGFSPVGDDKSEKKKKKELVSKKNKFELVDILDS